MATYDYLDVDKSLTWKLNDAHRQIMDELKQKEDRQRLKEEIKKEILEEIRIQINDEASPILKDLNSSFNNLFK